MDIASQPDALRGALDALRQGHSVALVPTMGNLHAGHLALVARAREMADRVVVSIFVNPLQFGPSEDLASYPRTLQADIEHLREAGADLLFTPTAEAIYPEGLASHTRVHVPGLTDILCGASRPGHFDGVTTVVCKLLNLVAPEVALFGEKDLQQLLVIRKMVSDLGMPIRIEGVPIVRDADGLALSSRNQYLSPEERIAAALLPQVLADCERAIQGAQTDYAALLSEASARLSAGGFVVDYLELRSLPNLGPAVTGNSALALLAAARLGKTRLIDNRLITRGESVS